MKEHVKEQVKDQVMPNEKWVFDDNVTKCFPNMLARSIPGYEQMRELTFAVGSKYLEPGKISTIVDVGSSNGLGVEPFMKKYGASLRVWLADNSEPMIEDAKTRYEGWCNCGVVHADCMDLITEYPQAKANLTLCTLTLQFTPLEERQQIIRKMYNHTIDGGALILVEKVQGQSAKMDDMLTELYYNTKRANGYNEEQIMAKRKSLRGVLVPLKPEWNEQLLKEAGFKNVQMFWRNLNFCAWVAEK